MPDVTIIIPTRERWPVLRETLAALGRQELAGLSAELVVVDNASREGSLDRLRAAEPPAGLALTVLSEATPGAAAARNAGLLAARSELVLFLGDDCRPVHGDFVAGHVRAHRDAGTDRLAVLGRSEWDPALGSSALMRWLEASGKMVDFGSLEGRPPGPGHLYTGNASLPRSAALEVGGFDARFRGYGWEDHDLGLRLGDHGLRVEYRPDLLVHHAHRYTLADSLGRMRAVGRGANLLRRLHAHREPPPGPSRGGRALAAARALAPVLTRLPVPDGLPGPVRRRLYQAGHLAALAQGEAAEPLPDDPALRGWAADGRPERPAVSVIVPFLGDDAEAEGTLGALAALRLREGDEVIVADNSPGAAAAAAKARGGDRGGSGHADPGHAERVRVVPAREEQSSYYARNAAAERAHSDWLLFVDSDCRPRRGLLDDYFREPVSERTGALAGAVRPDPRQRGLVARYARSRGHLSQAAHFRDQYRPYGITANLLVRRQAWAGVGGFYEGLRSGGDADICWRLQDSGWELAYREHAAVEHRHREAVRPLLRQAARYGAAISWMERRHPGSGPRPQLLVPLARCAGGFAWWSLTLRPRRALFKLLDALVIGADAGGRLFGNAAPRAVQHGDRAAGRGPTPAAAGRPPEIVVMVDTFPELAETFVANEVRALARAGRGVRVEALGRPARPNRLAARGLRVNYREDDGIARALADTAALVARHPLRSARDVLGRRRWRREEAVRPLRALAPLARRLREGGERHLHAHFAAGAALDAMRLGRLLGLPFSVTAHAYDIYLKPASLREKLERAAFATSGCDYTVRDLRKLAPAADVHEIVMGVDGERFARRARYPGGRTVVAVGRLVEKKGFEHLLDAAAQLAGRAPLDRVVIAGDGPLRARLAGRVRERGLDGAVDFAGALDPDEVRDLLERADLLAMPCVVARDGDRDSMPVVVKEALAMEVPVVASDEVGLPEIVQPEWGRLVPPADPSALASAIEELLALDPAERERMGRAGREFVLGHANVERETAKLAELIDAAARAAGTGAAGAAGASAGGSSTGGSSTGGASTRGPSTGGARARGEYSEQ